MSEDRKSLMQLAQLVTVIPSMLEASGGEITPEIQELIEISEGDLTAKVDSYQFVLERIELEQSYAKEKAAEWSKVAKSFDLAKSRLKENLKFAMKTMQKTELVGEQTRFILTPVKPALVIDEEALSDAYKMIVQTTVPDKEKIRADLEVGVSVPGAKLEQGFALRSYPATSAAKPKLKAKKSPDEVTIQA